MVADIISDVRARGDAGAGGLTPRFDRFRLPRRSLAVHDAEIDAAAGDCDAETISALELAARPDRGLSRTPAAAGRLVHRCAGVELGHRWTAVDAVGLYVPGGTAAYPSSV